MKRALLALALAAACSGEPPPPPPTTPVAPQAAVVIEPPRLRVGDVAVVEVSVVTPPGQRVLPLRPPSTVERLWLLDAESLPVETSGARAVHRTRIRVRARELGATEWPALQVEIEDAQGARSTLATEARPLEVVAALPPAPDRVEPFAYRLPAAASGPAPVAAALAGAAAALLAVALVALARRVRRRGRERRARAEALAASQPWVEALDALARARACDDTDWRQACGDGARALRRYLGRRFDLPDVESRPSEELDALRAPYLLASKWQSALACLRALDADRFRLHGAADAAARTREALDAAERFVRSTIPADHADDAARPPDRALASDP